MHKKSHTKPSGFTLVELALATAIFAFFLVIAVTAIINIAQIFQKSNTVRSNQQAARILIEEMRREASFAEKVTLLPGVSKGGKPGLCIKRGAGGEVAYYLAEVSADFPLGYNGHPGGFYNTNRLYKSGNCTTLSGPVPVGGNDSDFDNNSVTDFTLSRVNSPVDADFAKVSYQIDLTVSQKGPPAGDINSNKIEFDDTTSLSAVIYPQVQ